MAKKYQKSKRYCRNYERRQKRKGAKFAKKILHLIDLLSKHTEMSCKGMMYVVLLIYRERLLLSYRRFSLYLQDRTQLVERCHLKKIPGKSCLQKASARIAGHIKEQQNVILLQAEADALGTLVGDSTGISLHAYAD